MVIMSQHLLRILRSILFGLLAFALVAANGLVDMNKATEQEISELPGVGKELAKKIVEGRPYASIEDLRRSVPAELLKELAPRITVSRIQSEPHGGQAGLIAETKPAASNPTGPEAYAPDLERASFHGHRRTRIAILNFDYASVADSSKALLGADTDIGKGIADLLGRHLSDDTAYVLVDRKSTDVLLSEQSFSASSRADPETAARIGKLLGVDAILIGSVTKFGRDDKSTGGIGSHLGGFGNAGGITSRPSKAVVRLNALVVDVKTGEIVTAVEGDGEAARKGSSLAGSGAGSTGGTDMSSKGFGETILGEATADAIAKLIAGLDQNAPKTPLGGPPPVDGLVADVSGSSVILNVGAAQGLHVGEHLKVARRITMLRDPATGSVMRHKDMELGEVTITSVDKASATATYSGQAQLKTGDRVTR